MEPTSQGQREHDLRLGKQPDYINDNLSHLNNVMIEPKTIAALRDDWKAVKDRVGNRGKIRSNQNLSYAGIITFGTEAQVVFDGLSVADQDAAFMEVGMKVAAHFNTPLTGMVIHRDETAPHAHFQVRGIADDGTMLSQVVKAGALRKVQDIAAEVMGKHAKGIERGKSRKERLAEGEDYAATVNRSVKQLHTDLPREIAEAEAKRDEAFAKAAKEEDRAEKARLKADANEAASAKHLKNAQTYENRATKALAEAAKAQSDLDRLTGLVSAETAELETVTSAVAQKKTTIDSLERSNASLRKKAATLQARLKALKAA
jgi:hypothetical protein